ncbi:hypothetical protein G7Y79_00080g100590 [Physcia stellaris]|nr:hypothetical protein G7Y79_00080g100590 [Physcia stellaris]
MSVQNYDSFQNQPGQQGSGTVGPGDQQPQDTAMGDQMPENAGQQRWSDARECRSTTTRFKTSQAGPGGQQPQDYNGCNDSFQNQPGWPWRATNRKTAMGGQMPENAGHLRDVEFRGNIDTEDAIYKQGSRNAGKTWHPHVWAPMSGLPHDTTQSELESWFTQCGGCLSCNQVFSGWILLDANRTDHTGSN